MDKYKSWLIDYLSAPAGSEGDNYFEKGLIDSFGVIDLVEELEHSFNIKFEQKHFEDRRFATINGLAEILLEVRGE